MVIMGPVVWIFLAEDDAKFRVNPSYVSVHSKQIYVSATFQENRLLSGFAV